MFVTFDQFYTNTKGEISRTPTVSKGIDPLGLLDAARAARSNPPPRRKPWNVLRRLQIRRELGYWKF